MDWRSAAVAGQRRGRAEEKNAGTWIPGVAPRRTRGERSGEGAGDWGRVRTRLEAAMLGMTNPGAGGWCMTHVRIRPWPIGAFLLADRKYRLFRPRPDKDPQLGRGPLLLDCVTHGRSLQDAAVLTPGTQHSRRPSDGPGTVGRAISIVQAAPVNSTCRRPAVKRPRAVRGGSRGSARQLQPYGPPGATGVFHGHCAGCRLVTKW